MDNIQLFTPSLDLTRVCKRSQNGRGCARVCVYVCAARQEVGRAIFMHVCLAETPVWGWERGGGRGVGGKQRFFTGLKRLINISASRTRLAADISSN